MKGMFTIMFIHIYHEKRNLYFTYLHEHKLIILGQKKKKLFNVTTKNIATIYLDM